MKIKVLLLFVIPFVFSCKKGEDDPAFTVLSRTKRLQGDWVLKSCWMEGKYETGGTTVDDFVFISDGVNCTYKENDSANTKLSGPHQLLLHFDKKGGLNVKENLFADRFDLDGTWDFLNKEGDAKNKERILLEPSRVNSGFAPQGHTIFYGSMERAYYLRELRKDKLVLVYEGKPNFESAGQTLNLKAEFTFGR